MTYPLGRRVDHDPRNREYEHEPVSVVQPRTVLWPHVAPVLDQGQLGSCTGNALTQWLNTEVYAHPRGGYLDESVAVQLYSLATSLDPYDGQYPPTDTGSSGRAVCQAGRKLGYLSGYKWAFSFAGLLRALQSSPVIVGTGWHQDMFNPDAQGYLRPTGPIVGGHEYLILGCDMEGQFLTMLNSWGSGWGANGRAKISFTDFAALLKEHGDVTVPVVVASAPAATPATSTPVANLNPAYRYKAKLIKLVDGDTLHVEIDLGCDVSTHQTLRLAGLNAPEMSTPEGRAARDFAWQWLLKHAPDGLFVIDTVRDEREKYGRYLATVLGTDGASLNVELLASGNAVIYNP